MLLNCNILYFNMEYLKIIPVYWEILDPPAIILSSNVWNTVATVSWCFLMIFWSIFIPTCHKGCAPVFDLFSTAIRTNARSTSPFNTKWRSLSLYIKKKFDIKLFLMHIYAMYLPCFDDISHYSHYTTRIGNQFSQPRAILPSVVIFLSFVNDRS